VSPAAVEVPAVEVPASEVSAFEVSAFEVLAEPNRRRILDLLREAERPVGDLVDALGVSQPAVSKHLRVLREAGLVDVRAEAQRRLYRVRPEPLRAVDEWLAPYRTMWSDRLDALERHLAVMAREAGGAGAGAATDEPTDEP
jgi:DNA-binding transcriptional ArsR family regulator